MAESTFRGTFDFLEKIGVLDVVLPFLLVFTIVFAILEKTRVFGTEVIDGKHYTKKNLNSLAAFAIAFFAVASSRVVEALTQISANVVILLLASVFFLMLIGSFHHQTDEKGFALEGPWKTLFILIVFVGLFGIFLNAIKTDDKTWLEWIFGWLSQFSDNVSVATIVLIGLVIAAMIYVTSSGKPLSPAAKT
ncbi:hypothetical protein HYU16_03710 [Candidatus Woesearchaeota archaeon]|nr:hypothetical protein [Candidatus Woesearchaeota archaeon]